MEGIDTLNWDLMRGLPSCSRVFVGKANFRASLSLFVFVKNVSLLNPSLDPACTGEGGGLTPYLTRQGLVEASTRGVTDASLLVHQLDGLLASADSLWMGVRFRLAVIPSTTKALFNHGTFAFVALHLFSEGGRHSSAIADLLCLIKMLEETHTKVQGMISSPHLATTLLYSVSRQWSQYLNRCMAASASKVVEDPGISAPFSLEPIMVELGGGRYIHPILPIYLTNLVAVGRRSASGGTTRGGGGRRSSSGGNGRRGI